MDAFFPDLIEILQLKQLFPNIETFHGTRQDFVQQRVQHADIIVFTGKPENAALVSRKLKKDALFVFNGWGCNPLIINQDADLVGAAKAAVELKLFNSGQDCGGPDQVLVHTACHDELLVEIKKQLQLYARDKHKSEPHRLCEPEQLIRSATFLHKHRHNIIFGGGVDFAKGTVEPTLIVKKDRCSWNFDELFSPIMFVSAYQSGEELKRYVTDSRYKKNEMYLSVFGSIPEVLNSTRSIILREATIHDVEDGAHAYGGYAVGASYVERFGAKRARPVHLPTEIAEYAADLYLRLKSDELGGREMLVGEFKNVVTSIFGDNLLFAFVFGSVAKGLPTKRSDLDTFIAVTSHQEEQKKDYINWLKQHTHAVGMTFDKEYPAEIVTVKEIESSWAQPLHFSDRNNVSLGLYDALVWAEAITGEKCSVVGKTSVLAELQPKAGKTTKQLKRALWSAFSAQDHSIFSGLSPRHRCVHLGSAIGQEFSLSELSRLFRLSFETNGPANSVEHKERTVNKHEV